MTDAERFDTRYVSILAQPNDVSCGPTCLHAVYNHFNDTLDLDQVIEEVKQIKGGGTLAVMLGNHALKRGYKASIYTYNLQVFDPTWFEEEISITEKLIEQVKNKPSKKLKQATKAYLHFLSAGGQIKFEELSPALLRRFLKKKIPILTGLSATYLYQSAREIGDTNVYHDTKGDPAGHFVVISGYDQEQHKVLIADPLKPNPLMDKEQYYAVDMQRVINAILLGIVTYDANLLILEPR